MNDFKNVIEKIVKEDYTDEIANYILNSSDLIKYIVYKTKSANESSKARASFGNLYALYVLIEDYLKNGFDNNDKYKYYEGAMFSKLLNRQRELPFGAKLQNHSLNNRMNSEFKKICSTCDYQPILRNVDTNRYWINENLIKIDINASKICIAKTIIKIIDAYISSKMNSFNKFIETCERLKTIDKTDNKTITDFILQLIRPEMDARIFEIVSYSILKFYYKEKFIFWGYSKQKLKKENLLLFKTGRTNANDGGIDFVMKPLGRFFQVTETLDIKKYFLDIDKIEKYPLTFVVKTDLPVETIKEIFLKDANKLFGIKSIVSKYMSSIEEIINTEKLKELLLLTIKNGKLINILDEIVLQSKLEFNYINETD